MITRSVAVLSRNFCKTEALKSMMRQKFANVKFNEVGKAYRGQELAAFLKGAEGVIVALEPFDDELLSQLPELKFISKYGVGLNNLDIPAIERRNIRWACAPGVNRRSVAELTLGFMLTLLNNSYVTGRKLVNGQWEGKGGVLLTGKTVGIIGFGHVGRDLAGLLRGFGCKVLFHDILDLGGVAENFRAIQLSKEELLKAADVVTLHVPYDKSTHHLIKSDDLALMKDDAILINTSRGNVICEEDLLSYMKRGKLRGAASDVFAEEPNSTSPLFQLPNFFPTPHIGGASREAIMAMGTAAIENLYKMMK